MENSENDLSFTEAENKIRKKWLFWSIKLPVSFLACVMVLVLFNAVISSDFQAVISILLFALLFLGGEYMNYYCAYKNPGTILLLLGMIGNSYNLIAPFFHIENLALMKESMVFSLFMLMMSFFSLIVFYYSYKLRKINQNMQKKILRASPVYINAVSVFSTATSLEELNEQFTKLRASDDSGNAVKILAKAYDKQKKMLKLAQD